MAKVIVKKQCDMMCLSPVIGLYVDMKDDFLVCDVRYIYNGHAKYEHLGTIKLLDHNSKGIFNGINAIFKDHGIPLNLITSFATNGNGTNGTKTRFSNLDVVSVETELKYYMSKGAGNVACLLPREIGIPLITVWGSANRFSWIHDQAINKSDLGKNVNSMSREVTYYFKYSPNACISMCYFNDSIFSQGNAKLWIPLITTHWLQRCNASGVYNQSMLSLLIHFHLYYMDDRCRIKNDAVRI